MLNIKNSEKVRDEKYLKRRFSFIIEADAQGSNIIMQRLRRFLNDFNWAYDNVKVELID